MSFLVVLVIFFSFPSTFNSTLYLPSVSVLLTVLVTLTPPSTLASPALTVAFWPLLVTSLFLPISPTLGAFSVELAKTVNGATNVDINIDINIINVVNFL